MNQNGGRNVGTSAAGLLEAENLEAASDGEKEDRRREEDPNVMVG
jgi:hypothetical protein